MLGATLGQIGRLGRTSSMQQGIDWPITNPDGLTRYRSALASGSATIWAVGNSIPWGVGWDGTAIAAAEADARLHSWPDRLSRLFATRLGTNASGFIGANAVAPDNLLVATNTTVSTSVGLASLCRVINNTGPGILTFNLPSCTAFDIIYWESNGTNGNPVTGNFTYAVDGGTAIPVAYAATPASYKLATVNGISNTSHTVVITGTSSGSAFVVGIRFRDSKGIVVGRFGRPGWTILDLIGTGSNNSIVTAGQTRVQNASGMGSPNLLIIMLRTNECMLQLTAGQLTTPEVFKTSLPLLYNAAIASGSSVLFVADPSPPYAQPVGGAAFSAYADAMRELAESTQNVSFVNVDDLLGWGANAQATGFQNSGSVHPTDIGYIDIANNLFRLLT